MKKLLLAFFMVVASPTPLPAQNDPEEPLNAFQKQAKPHLSILQTGEKILRWTGHPDFTYFIQASADLRDWTWAPNIETGRDALMSYEVDGPTAKGFFRLVRTQQTAVDPDIVDFDGDGLGNLYEITPRPRPGGIVGYAGLDPNIQTSPIVADTDEDGLNDLWEQTYGFDPTDNGNRNINNGPTGDSDNDGASNIDEQNGGTNPNDAAFFPVQVIRISKSSYGFSVTGPAPASERYATFRWGANWFEDYHESFSTELEATPANLLAQMADVEFPALPPASIQEFYSDEQIPLLGRQGIAFAESTIFYSKTKSTPDYYPYAPISTRFNGAISVQRAWLKSPVTTHEQKFQFLRQKSSQVFDDDPWSWNITNQILSTEAVSMTIPAGQTYSAPIDFDPLPTVVEGYSVTSDALDQLSMVKVMQRTPIIDNAGGDTTYSYKYVSAVPWDQPTPGVEITANEITGNQVKLNAKIYDVLADVSEGDTSQTPQLWVNSRAVEPQAGDKDGVYRLQDYNYKLFPGRNEITVAVQNGLGVEAHHTLVIQGDAQRGYQVVEKPAKVPTQPTYPVVYDLNVGGLVEDQKITLKLADKSVEVGKEENGGMSDGFRFLFRSKPFVSVNQPESATPAQISATPADKPIFLADLDEDLEVQLELPSRMTPVEWTAPQSGLELIATQSVQVLQTTDLSPNLQFKARGLGDSSNIKAKLTTYQNDEIEADVSNVFISAYNAAYLALAGNERNNPFTFTVSNVHLKEGYNNLTFNFSDISQISHGGNYHSFRFPNPTKNGVRIFSANRKTDAVLDGVTGRLQDFWYPVAANSNLSILSTALEKNGCQVVGMTDVMGMFDGAPLKRSYLVRGPPGRTFQAFDYFYEMLDREQRGQTFAPDGPSGTALADELERIQDDDDLPNSARNALGLEVARTFQLHNGFEAFVPKTHQAYIDPGNGIQQPNSWTMRGSSLPDHAQSNPSPWTVTNTLSDPLRAASVSGIVKVDTTAESTAYYATTPANAPWNLTGARAVSLRFKLLTHDAANGGDGAFQLAAGDGTRTWTCQVAPAQVKVQGTTIALPAAKFPTGLIDGKFHTLQINLSGTGNDALVSIDGEVLTATAASQPGTLNGIAFGDPGAGIAGKFETETLAFENSDLRYQYGYIADDYADSDELAGGNNILLYLRSKGQPYENSAIASWVNLFDQNVNEWLLETYTGQSKLNGQQELYVYARSDVWLGSIVDVEETEVDYSGIPYFSKRSKTSRCLNLDKEQTKFFSSDQTRNEMQLAGLLMAWVYQQDEYKEWLAEKNGGGTGTDGLLLHKKHCVENIAKCAKHVETTLSVGGEIAVSITNEYVDYAITINSIRQGDYMAMVGFIPLVPSSTARAFKFINKVDGTLIEGLDRLCKKFPDFPAQPVSHIDQNQIPRTLSRVNLFADHTDSVAVEKMRKIATNQPMSAHGPGSRGGHELLSTFSNQAVICYKTKEPTKAYRIFDSNNTAFRESNFLTLEPPISKSQAEADYALGDTIRGPFQPNYDTWIEVEIPSGSYIFTGVAGEMSGKYVGGGRQVFIEDDVISGIDWVNPQINNLPAN